MTGIDDRADRWASTMRGHVANGTDVHLAHADSWAGSGSPGMVSREEREDRDDAELATLATRARGGGNRAVDMVEAVRRTHLGEIGRAHV